MAEEKRIFKLTIVEKAAEVFSHYGYKKTTMDDIAAEVSKGKSSIYYYFESKEDIFKAVVEHEAEIVRKQLIEEIEKYSEHIDKLRSYVLKRMQLYKEVANFYRVITNGLSVQLDFIRDMRETYHAQEIDLVADILREGQQKNVFAVEDSKFAALAIVTALRGLEAPLIKNSSHPIEKRLDKLLQILFMGIVKR